jgi:dUTP pyrophosphatase
MKFLKVSYEQYEKDKGGECHGEHFLIKLPKRATTGSAGYDFFAPFAFELQPKASIKIPTGVRVDLNNDKELNLFLAIYPRSGLGFKYMARLANGTALIDSDYFYSDNEGHIMIKLTNENNEGKSFLIRQGEAFAQGIIQQYFKVDDDDTTDIRNGGFGSTTGK